MSIGTNIKKLREENNLTQKELAQISGVTDKAVSLWENDERVPRMGALSKMADRFGIKISDILSENSVGRGVINAVSLPLVKRVPLLGKVFFEGDVLGHLPALPEELLDGEKYIYYILPDQRMSPLMQKGDAALVHLKNFIESGRFGLVSVDGGEPLAVKIIFSGEEVLLQSENPDFAPLCFKSSEFKRLKVLGEIKKLVRNF